MSSSDATMSSSCDAVDEFKLIGPPSIQSLVDISPPTGNSFIDLMVNNFNNSSSSSSPSPPPSPKFFPAYRHANPYGRGFTETGTATYITAANPLVDFFFHVVPDTHHESVTQRLEQAWNYDSLSALKLICNLRGVRGTGKSDKEGFYAAALWLHQNHPKTLAINLKALADFGYFKDLPEVLYRLHEGVGIRKERKQQWWIEKKENYAPDPKTGKLVYQKKGKEVKPVKPVQTRRHAYPKRGPMGKRVRNGSEDVEPKKKKSKKENTIELSKRALERYAKDAKYKDLHDKISDLFAEYLISDLKHLNSGEIGKISLASKWCPSLDSCFDKASLLCEGIARRIFPRNSHPDYENLDEAHYAYRIRDRLRREYLVPLRKVLELPEVYMSSKMWESLPYNRVASVAMKKYKGFFEEHDKERFNAYLGSVKKGETKIAAGALLPHEIIASLEEEVEKDGDCNAAELQWRRMLDDLAKIGKLTNTLAIVDTSDSMEGTPMEVAIALGLLVSEMCEDPWKGKIITFSHVPDMLQIKGDNLRAKSQFIRRMKWGGSTNFRLVFEQILQVAVDANLKKDEMIKRLFVFSDMEFTAGAGKYDYDWIKEIELDPAQEWETDYKVIENSFREKGYNVPDIVFWNLKDSRSTPVLGQTTGVALVSGFSKNMLKLFLEGSDFSEILSPISLMEQAISGEEYNKLVVVD